MPSGWTGCDELGHGDDALARIRGPVGLNIGAVTAPEIALSILAEIVAGPPRRFAREPRRPARVIFGPTALAEAEGAVLAHTPPRAGPRAEEGGRCWMRPASHGLRAAGLDPVVAARMEPGDVGEDAAARRIATALLGPGLTLTAGAATGRVNLVAASAGLLRRRPRPDRRAERGGRGGDGRHPAGRDA